MCILLFQPEQLTGLTEAEYVEIIRYIVLQYEDLDNHFNKLTSDHENLHVLYEVRYLYFINHYVSYTIDSLAI